MPIRRITISVPEAVARRVKKAAGGTPVSAWVTEVIAERLDDAELQRQWREFCRDVDPTPADVRRATATFRRLTRSPHRRGAA